MIRLYLAVGPVENFIVSVQLFCPAPREPAFALVGGTGIEPVTSAL